MLVTPPAAPQPVLELRDVEVVLGTTHALAGVTARIDQGESVALMGPNGSGKSTLVRAALRLVPSRGSIDLFGTPQQRFRAWSRVGYVPQASSPSLQRATVREVVSSGLLAQRSLFSIASRQQRQRVAEVIEQVGLHGREGWEMAELSGGQQQRARIARALAGRPELLVLDEPLTGLDLASQEGLADLLRELTGQGLTMLVVLHELGPLGPLMSRSLVLEHGHLVHDGPPPSLEPSGGKLDHSCHGQQLSDSFGSNDLTGRLGIGGDR